MESEIVVREEKQLEGSAEELVAQASALAVTDSASLALAGDFLKAAKAGQRAVEEAFGGIIKANHAAWKAAIAKRDQYLKPFVDIEAAVKGKALAYQAEQERIQREEQARLVREAREREEAARLAEAAALEEAGYAEEAQAVMDAPVEVSVAPPAKVLVNGAGFVSVKVWKARVVDKAKVVAFVAGHPEWLHLLDVNEANLNAVAKAMKANLNIDGAVAYEDTGTRAAGKR